MKWWNTGEGQRRVSTLSLTYTLDGVGWLTPHSGRFTPCEETLVHIIQEAEWVSGPVWRVWEIWLPTGFEPQTARPVAIRCTGSATPDAGSWRMMKFWVGGRLLLTSAEGPKFLELFEVIKSTCSWTLYWPGRRFWFKSISKYFVCMGLPQVYRNGHISLLHQTF
jgi:hypothetical protein